MRPELMRLGKSIVMVWEDRVMAYFLGFWFWFWNDLKILLRAE